MGEKENEESKTTESKGVITEIPKQTVTEQIVQSVTDVRSTPTWAWMILFLIIFVTPYLGWFFGWFWWPSMVVYFVVVIVFGVLLSYWGRLRRSSSAS